MKRFLLCFLLVMLSYLTSTLIGPSTTPCFSEGQVISDVNSILRAQILYSITKGRGRATDLAHLGEVMLIDAELASGEKYGYSFEVRLVGQNGSMFDVIAKPKNQTSPCVGTKAFYTNETMVVYEAEGSNPPTATAEERIPREGRPLEENGDNSR